ALLCLVELVSLRPLVRLALTGRAGRAAVQSLLPPERLAALGRWTQSIWAGTLPELERLAEAIVAPPIAAVARRALLEVLAEVADRRNLCPRRVGMRPLQPEVL
ncbi:unnamed protein product, partial [Polarella glacialis]